MEQKELLPLEGYAYLLDDHDAVDNGGVLELRGVHAKHLDYVVVRGAGEGWGPGDRVMLDEADAGRRLRADGVAYRVVPVDRIVAVMC